MLRDVVIRSSHGDPLRALAWASAALLAGGLVGCGSATDGAARESAAPLPTATATATHDSLVPSAATPITADYVPGQAAQLRLPAKAGAAPLIVMVPGGGWATADPTGLVPLAAQLTDDGASTALITYATTSTHSTFPEAVDDVACAVRWATAQAAAHGHPATHVIVLGHSAGGHLAALVSFSGSEFGSRCPYPVVRIDGLIGLAGVYDTDQFQPVLAPWMGKGPAQAPDAWRRVNPTAWLRDGKAVPSGLRVLLIHGDADTSVPLAQTTSLARNLDAAGIDVRTDVLPGLGHLEIFQAPHAEPPIRAWLDDWPMPASAATPAGLAGSPPRSS